MKVDLLGLAACVEVPQICDEQELYDRAACFSFIKSVIC